MVLQTLRYNHCKKLLKILIQYNIYTVFLNIVGIFMLESFTVTTLVKMPYYHSYYLKVVTLLPTFYDKARLIL